MVTLFTYASQTFKRFLSFFDDGHMRRLRREDKKSRVKIQTENIHDIRTRICRWAIKFSQVRSVFSKRANINTFFRRNSSSHFSPTRVEFTKSVKWLETNKIVKQTRIWMFTLAIWSHKLSFVISNERNKISKFSKLFFLHFLFISCFLYVSRTMAINVNQYALHWFKVIHWEKFFSREN